VPDGPTPPSPQNSPPELRSRLVVLAGPTAVGKGTVADCVRRNHPDIWISVSVTTRRPRPGEIDGLHYHFVDDDEFDRLVASDGLLEWAVVHRTARYGTPRAPVEEMLAAGRPALLRRNSNPVAHRSGGVQAVSVLGDRQPQPFAVSKVPEGSARLRC